MNKEIIVKFFATNEHGISPFIGAANTVAVAANAALATVVAGVIGYSFVKDKIQTLKNKKTETNTELQVVEYEIED